MVTERLDKILKNLADIGLTQMIVSDPVAIFYLTGRLIDPNERLLALYISAKGDHKFFVNELFTVPEDLGVEKVRFSDTDDYMGMLAERVDRFAPMGIDKDFPARFLLRLMELNPGVRYVNSSLCVDRVRACKDPLEQERMRAASKLNDQCMAALSARLCEGITEREVAELALSLFREASDGPSFEPSIAFGPNAADGHHQPDGTRLKKGDCVLIDMGCVKDRYCSDMTRTFFFGEASAKQREVYELVRCANEAAEALVRPGARFCDLDNAARGLIAGAGYGPYFTHRLGHSIGIREHEFGDVSGANTDPLQPGMVFSIEPGIYLPDEMGVRIEDLVLVTGTGCEVLNSFPKTLSILE